MNNQQFLDSAHIYKISFDKFHHTDNSSNGGTKAYYFGYMQYGSGKFTFGKDKAEIKNGEIVFIPKEFPYESFWYPDGDGRLMWYSFEFALLPIPEHKFYPLQAIIPTDEEKRILDTMVLKREINSDFFGDLYKLFGNFEKRMISRESDAASKMSYITEAMREHPEYSNGELAEKCGISESKLYAIFAGENKTTPNDMRQQILCERADTLLTNTDKSVEEISDMLGYSSASYFRKIYKKHRGTTPLKTRKLNTKKV